MDDLISRKLLLQKLKYKKELFCKNRFEFMLLSQKDKARADEIDNCISVVLNAPSVVSE